MKIKQLVVPNYFDKTTHYYATSYARSVESGTFTFIKEYMNSKLKFVAKVKHEKQGNISFVEIDQIDGDYTDVVMLKGNPTLEQMKTWFIEKW